MIFALFKFIKIAFTFHSLKVSKLTKETSNSVSIVFDIPAELKSNFTFSSGQFLTLKHFVNGKELRRSYSLCSMPRTGEIKIAIKKIPNGAFSNFAVDTLKEGDFIDVAAPAGKFTLQCKSNNQRNYVFVAVGSGITPIISMIKTILNDEPLSSVSLLYGNKSQADTIFWQELTDLSGLYSKRLTITHFFSNQDTGSEITNGRISVSKVKQIAGAWGDLKSVFGYYLCGPQNMIEDISYFLQKEEGVLASQIHFELFNTVVAEDNKNETATEVFDKSLVTVEIRGVNYSFEVKPGQNILAAALSSRVDMPYSCQGGVCGSCECKVLSGSVDLNQNMILSDDEIEDGQTLACQAIPKTKEIKLTFDF